MMTTRKYTKLGLAAVVAGSVITGFTLIDNKARYTPRKGEVVENEKEEAEGAARYFFNIRKNAQTGELDLAAMLAAQTEVADLQASANKVNAGIPLTWKELGPDNVGGRTRAVLIDLVNDPTGKTIFAGGVAGGLWKSTTAGGSWVKVNDFQQNLSVSCITEAPNGDIYYGTGEGHYNFFGSVGGGMIGGGIFKSTDHGSSFRLLTATKPAVGNDATQRWAQVNAMATDPDDLKRIYACVADGLMVSSDSGATWTKAPSVLGQGQDVEVGSDHSVMVAASGKAFKSATGNPVNGSFAGISGTGACKLPSTGASRLELAMSPSDPKYIYAWVSDGSGQMTGSYLTTDGGVCWTKHAQGGGGFNPFGTSPNTQGTYDNTLAVHPKNKFKAFGGGTDLYSYTYGAQQWTQISSYFGGNGFPLYVHPDKHAIAWNKNDTDVVYFGCDGGMYKTQNANAANVNFHSLNRNYNVTQFYSVSFSKTGEVMGGAQDNGTQLITYMGNTPMTAFSVAGGDGGYSEISNINPNALIMESQNGSMVRSSNFGNSASGAYTTRISNALSAGTSFITPFQLWESIKDLSSPDSLALIANAVIPNNTTINVNSSTYNYPFTYTTTQAYNPGDTIWVKDIVQTKFAIGFSNSVWLAKNMLDFSGSPAWMRIASSGVSYPDPFSGVSQSMEFTKDGNHLYVGTDNGVLYRISNLSTIRLNRMQDTLTGEIGNPQSQVTCTRIASFGRPICGIGVDANDNGKVIVCLGSYDGVNNSHIYYSTTADTDTTGQASFVAKNGSGATKLPGIIVYDGIIDYTDGKKVVLGTDFGVYTTSDITAANPQWTKDAGFPNAPVVMVRQQQRPWNWPGLTNTGVIYAATHGRGFWSTASLMGIKDNSTNVTQFKAGVSVYPNPARDITNVSFTLEETGPVTLNIYDLQGRLAKTFELGKMPAGKNSYRFDSNDLEHGTYIITMTSSKAKAVSKFIVAE